MINISPLSGYKNITEFTFTNPSSAASVYWGDYVIDQGLTASHIFSDIGVFNAYAGTCSSTSAFSLSVYNGEYFSDKILVTSDAISSLVSTPYTFNINLSSSSEISTVLLYASGSRSLPYQTDRNFWSHLNPEWEFRFNDEPISELSITGSPVYSGTELLGYSALSSVTFLDDMPGNIKLFFTVTKSEYDIPLNSHVYSSLSHSICAVDPDKLFITSDGINPLNRIQWSDNSIPYMISVGSSLITSTKILHYIEGYINNINFRSSCFGDNLSPLQYQAISSELADLGYVFVYSDVGYQLISYQGLEIQVLSSYANNSDPGIEALLVIDNVDENCLPTGGYTRSNLFYPTTALPDITITNNSSECNYNPYTIEFLRNRKSPRNITLSANAVVYYNYNEYALSGISDPFDIVAFENRHEFYREGEDYTVYDILKKSLPFDLEQHTNLNNYLSSVAGPGDTLGKVYDKICNFNKDHSDIELCTYDILHNKAIAFDDDIDDFGLEIPEELKRVFNFATIPLQKLIGTRCVCNTNFVDCNACVNSNICKICKYDKRSNLGDLILLTDYISSGETILYKENGGKYFNFLPVRPQDSDVYKLNTLSAEPIYSNGIGNYCFYRWDNSPQNNPIESVVNYKDSRNLLNPGLSSNNDWYADNGVVEEMFNYILTKNLLG